MALFRSILVNIHAKSEYFALEPRDDAIESVFNLAKSTKTNSMDTVPRVDAALGATIHGSSDITLLDYRDFHAV